MCCHMAIDMLHHPDDAAIACSLQQLQLVCCTWAQPDLGWSAGIRLVALPCCASHARYWPWHEQPAAAAEAFHVTQGEFLSMPSMCQRLQVQTLVQLLRCVVQQSRAQGHVDGQSSPCLP